MKKEQIECSETSAYKIQTPGNYPKEYIIYSEHGESLNSRINGVFLVLKKKFKTEKSFSQNTTIYSIT